MEPKDSENILRYAPFSSVVAPGFWHNLSQLKLDVDRLCELPRKIWGYYSASDPPGFNMSLFVDYSSFNSEFTVEPTSLPSNGVLINTNTLESFKETDKMALVKKYGEELKEMILNGDALKNPWLLSKFILLTHADLKKHQFYYWFAFVSPKFPDVQEIQPAMKIDQVLSPQQVESLSKQYSGITDSALRGFLCVTLDGGGNISLLPLESYCSAFADSTQRTFLCFADPSNLQQNPGWPLRTLLALIPFKWQHLVGSTLEVIGLRRKFIQSSWSVSESVLFTLRVPSLSERQDEWVGWERNARGKFGPRMADLGATMDPLRLAETSVDLNLKLMKWRLLPELDLDVVKGARVLLLGAGTLGCCVARLLLGWGVREMTLVDNGHVSYSNPVRQMLFTFEDCKDGGRPKAEAAADALRKVFPGVVAKGVKLSIPMPGHGASQRDEVVQAAQQLEELICASDVVFLLTDTRESRWLPTMLSSFHGKLAINAALGFDTFLVMRHGMRPAHSAPSAAAPPMDFTAKLIGGEQLGCYFCNDIVAPGNSTRDRTLDQQCTVTRPGVSLLAGALAVELAVSVLQHPMRGCASAWCVSAPMGSSDEAAGPLGAVPHSVRGFLSQFQLLQPATQRFTQCVACSSQVLDEYAQRGTDFLVQVFEQPGYLEDVTGLTQLHQEVPCLEVLELSDSECASMD
ncbi:ubiquitin-like modifier-activating enzyme ATG7 [Ischnura elegans]|uniref:ubiquitin-like modifier-activating enzyme ATG7 n=1 Tax=Ischnura elegans TaxID=197161 RepID=UPI001ED8AAF7|nr:ubiquitin-like modifier-activating enzyme ATG7 [Ischnura elegans]